MCFLILLERVVIVRKIASHLPQVGWMNSKSGEEKRLPAIWWTHSGSVAWESRNQSQEILSWGTWLTPAASQPLGKCATAPPPLPLPAPPCKREGHPESVPGLRLGEAHLLPWIGREREFPGWCDRILYSNLFVPGCLPWGPSVGIMDQTPACISVTSRWALKGFSCTKGSTVLPHLPHQGQARRASSCSD